MPSRRQAEITFPDRVWEPTGNGQWVSRPVNTLDYIQRGKVLFDLGAVSNSPHIPYSPEVPQ